MQLSRGKVIKYFLLPGFIPRLWALGTGGFSHISYHMALIYATLRLLPSGHAYLKPENIGRYGIRHVIAEAANHLVFSRKNIDQIIVFFVLLAGIFLLISQFALLIGAVILQNPAFAQISASDLLSVGSTYGHAGAPQQDLAFIVMDKIFGLKNIFGSCISDTNVACKDINGNPIVSSSASGTYPYPFHIALHELLRFYSLGIFVVSVFIILYFVTTIVAETAETGTPFGQRYNHTWTPVRLILFFALLVPLNIGSVNAGLNGAQLITFWSVKYGSNFATNAWGKFNTVLTTSYLGDIEKLVATPNVPELGNLVQFMFVAKTCKIAEEVAYNPAGGVQAWLVRDNLSSSQQVLSGEDALDLNTTNFDTAVKFSNYGNITLRFGHRNVVSQTDPAYKEYSGYKAFVKPNCGDLTILVSSVSTSPTGSKAIQEEYYSMIKDMWKDTGMSQYAECIVRREIGRDPNPHCPFSADIAFANLTIERYRNRFETKLPSLIAQEQSNPRWQVPAALKEKGWAAAALWYNRIAEINGAVVTAVFNIPIPLQYPYVMETLAEQKRQSNKNLNPEEIYKPWKAQDNEPIKYQRYMDAEIEQALYKAFSFWENDNIYLSHYAEPSGNVFIDVVNWIFGTNGIFDMRKNADIHPLAQLSALGKSMMEASIRNIGIGFAGDLLAKILPGYIGQASAAAASFAGSMGMVLISISFILFYVLPFMPFIYFLFAVTSWVKSIFEAVVAMPLWALSHIHIDGDGLPGRRASNGYFLLLEIFFRPILIVLALLATISIFSAEVAVLNQIFELVVHNATGFDHKADISGGFSSIIEFMRSPIDKFFFTVIYVVICYLMGISAFKLIDVIPNDILRWIGTNVTSFEKLSGDPAGELASKVYVGSEAATGKLQGGRLAAFIGLT